LAAAHSDLQWWQRALAAFSGQDLFGMAATAWGEKP
jgi:hypothetical protein